MALQKVVFNIRNQMQRAVMVFSTRCYSNETLTNTLNSDNQSKEDSTSSSRSYSSDVNLNSSSFDPKNQEEYEHSGGDSDYKVRGAEGVNDVYITGTVFGEVLPTVTGNGLTFLVDIPHNGRYGPYRVRTKVVAFGPAVPENGAGGLKEGQKVFVRGRLGSKVERSQDGSSVVRTNHVVGRFVTLL